MALGPNSLAIASDTNADQLRLFFFISFLIWSTGEINPFNSHHSSSIFLVCRTTAFHDASIAILFMAWALCISPEKSLSGLPGSSVDRLHRRNSRSRAEARTRSIRCSSNCRFNADTVHLAFLVLKSWQKRFCNDYDTVDASSTSDLSISMASLSSDFPRS